MDRKSFIILALCLLAFLFVPRLVNKIYPPKPLPAVFTNIPNAEVSSTNSSAVTPPSFQPSEPGATHAQIAFNSSQPEQLIEVTNLTAHYTFSSYGGGLKEV